MRWIIMIDLLNRLSKKALKQKGARVLSLAPFSVTRSNPRENSLRVRTAGDDGDAAAILRPAGFVGLGADRTFLAIGHGFDAGGGDALADQILLHGIGAARTQRQIVFAGAAFVGMAFDASRARTDTGCSQAAWRPRMALSAVLDIVLVVAEMDGVADIDAEILGAARHDRWTSPARGPARSGRARAGGGAVFTASCLWVQAPRTRTADKQANFRER